MNCGHSSSVHLSQFHKDAVGMNFGGDVLHMLNVECSAPLFDVGMSS